MVDVGGDWGPALVPLARSGPARFLTLVGVAMIRSLVLAALSTSVALAQPRLVPDPAGLDARAPLGLGEVVAVDLADDGRLYVLQRADPPVIVFAPDGTFERTLGEGLIPRGHGLEVAPDGTIWVTDTADHVVLRLSPGGAFRQVLGRRATPGTDLDGRFVLFDQPTDVAIAPDGSVFVTDGYGNDRVIRFLQDGTRASIWGDVEGDGLNQFSTPHAVVALDDGSFWIADRQNQRLKHYAADGDVLEVWNVGYDVGGLAVAPDGSLWTTDVVGGRVLHHAADGSVAEAVGEPGRTLGRFGWPHGVAVAPDGTVYVAEILNWRVQVLRPASP